MPFIPGIDLCRRFYWEAISPLLDEHFPGLPHAAALIGPGSEVLGFDTELSTDHDWRPRTLLFLRQQDESLAAPLLDFLRQRLPHSFLGFDVGLDAPAQGAEDRYVTVITLHDFLLRQLAWDGTSPLRAADWLSFAAQALREVTAGEVYHDGTGELTAVRRQLAYYPDDAWLYLLACGWARISEEDHLMGRAGHAGDETGSAIIGGRLVRDLMALGFLMERQYAPYPKWFGTAFRQLACAAQLAPHLWQALQAAAWPERQAAICRAGELLAAQHNALGLTPPLPTQAAPFFNRPFQVIHAGEFAEALRGQIRDEEVKRIARRGFLGGIDTFSDSTELRGNAHYRPWVRRLIDGE